MYLDFFGFQRPPFELVPDPDFLFLGESHESAMANLAMGLEAGKGFVVITGPVGAGKTTILRAMLRRIGRDQNVCFLTQPEADIRDLLRAILEGFEQPMAGMDLADLRRTLRDVLRKAERPGILIVDEAHLIAEESLEQLRLLSNLEDDNRKLLQIVLSGQRELKELLARPRLRPLAQRIEMFYEIEALSAEETAAYIARRIRIAGSPDGLVFEDDALRSIHQVTGGIPRLINILADRALITAYVDDSRSISAHTVQEAWEDLGEVTQSVMTGQPTTARRKTERSRRKEVPDPAPLTQAAKPLNRTKPLPLYDAASSYPPPPPLPLRESVAVAPARVRTPRSAEERTRGRERWVAAAGLAVVVLLAVTSLSGGAALFAKKTAPVDIDREVPTVRGAAAGTEPAADLTPGADDATVAAPEIRPEVLEGRSDASPPDGAVAVQVASFRDLAKARQFSREIGAEMGQPTRVSPAETDSGLWYRVLLGECTSDSETRELMAAVRSRYDLSFLPKVRLLNAPAADAEAGTP